VPTASGRACDRSDVGAELIRPRVPVAAVFGVPPTASPESDRCTNLCAYVKRDSHQRHADTPTGRV